ncbi:hypothetical protein [Brenneria rubrifaciens]|nr:hypothetical protein [Brenneria rubrifaciens]
MPYNRILEQASHYLSQHQHTDLVLSLQRFDSLSAALQPFSAGHQPSFRIECVLLDARHEKPSDEEDPFLPFVHNQPNARFSPYSAMLLCQEECLGEWIGRLGNNRLVRVLHPNSWQRRADMLRLILDHLEHAYFNRMLVRIYQNSTDPVTVAKTIHRHMTARWGDQWDFHYFTGSMVARFINSMKELLQDSDHRCLTGNNEHALAVSALAGWQLYGRAYVIALTSGMIDEMRGTLANLKHAAAPGIIVCADSPSTIWYPFQGTLDADNNGHAVIAARGLWHCFIVSPDDMSVCMEGAFQALDNHPAPTFIMATQAILESQLDEPAIATPLPAIKTTALSAAQRERLDQAVATINHDNTRMLWHCDRLTPDERDRVLQLSEKAGIGLVDSIIHPGSVPAYREGVAVENYLGTLSLYGFNRAIYEFLETPPQQGESKPWLFFLKSRIEQSATPYSAIKLKRNFNVAQVNCNAAHLSPFTHLALDMRLTDFLDYVEPRLAVDDAVLSQRRTFIERLRNIPTALPSDLIETMPMTPNYFFHQLNLLLTDLIQRQGYRYTGVYDVGRCSLSAIRNVARTDPGFSGWYGRALMGDGLMSLPYIALNNERNVLAFIGDGARALVPDIEQRLILSSAKGVVDRGGNITVLYLTNGGLSMIQSYLDKRCTPNGYKQVDVPMAGWETKPSDSVINGVSVHRRLLRQFCPAQWREALIAPDRINFFDVWLGHNSEGDGLGLISEDFWSRLPISNEGTL